VTIVSGRLLDHVQQDPTQRYRLGVGRKDPYSDVQLESGDDFPGPDALRVVLIEQLGKRDVVHPHLAVRIVVEPAPKPSPYCAAPRKRLAAFSSSAV